MPVSRRNIGSRESRSPVSWVLVVVASVSSPPRCCAEAGVEQSESAAAVAAPNERAERSRVGIVTSVENLDLGEAEAGPHPRLADLAGDVFERESRGSAPRKEIEAGGPRP